MIKSLCSCVCTRFGSHRPNQVLAQLSLPCALIKSISSVVNVAIDIDFTRCGGVKPRLKVGNPKKIAKISYLHQIIMTR